MDLHLTKDLNYNIAAAAEEVLLGKYLAYLLWPAVTTANSFATQFPSAGEG
jgi:hypothetical protein